MPDETENIMDNLSPAYRKKSKQTTILNEDGSVVIINREIQTVRNADGSIQINIDNEIIVDSFGNLIRNADEFGGTCRCGKRAHRDFFYHCQKCAAPLCFRCVRRVNDKTYCSWCAFVVSLKRLFRIGRKHE